MALNHIIDMKLNVDTRYKNPEERFTEISKKLYICATHIRDVKFKNKLLDLLYASNKLKHDPQGCIYQLGDVLNNVFNTLVTLDKINTAALNEKDIRMHRRNVKKLLACSEQINGRSSKRLKVIGGLLMALAVFLVALSLVPLAFGVINILPLLSSNILLGVFGLSPGFAGIALFKFGYNKFEAGCQHGLSSKLSIFAKAARKPMKKVVFAESVHKPKLGMVYA